jgi:hypothetical protein
LPKINREYVKDMMSNKKDGEKVGKQMLEDDRFKNMFTSEDFKIDKNSEAYKLIKP